MNEYNKPEQYPRTYAQTHQQDEISLVDLWLILAKHKWVFAGVFLVVFALGVGYAFFKPITWQYSTLVEIGARLVGEEIEPIESPSSVVAKLEKGYVPQAQQEYYTAFPADNAFYAVKVNAPQNSALVTLQSTGQEDTQSAYIAIHQAAVDALLEDHARIVEVIRQGLKTRLIGQQNALQNLIDQAKLLEQQFIRLQETQANEMASLKAEATLLKAEKARITETEKLLQQQIEKYEQLIASAEENRPRAIKEADSEARAMTLLMINNQIEQSRNRLTDLRERLTIGIPRQRDQLAEKIANNLRDQQNLENQHANERDTLQQRIADNLRAQSETKAKIEETQLDIANLQQTRVVSMATQSLKPAGLGTKALLLLSAILAGFLGLLAVFLLAFSDAAKQRNKELSVHESG